MGAAQTTANGSTEDTRGSWKLCTAFGVGIYVHWSLLALLGFLFISDLNKGGNLSVALYGLGFVLAVFGCVVLHELGHALMARRFGIRTKRISLLALFGFAKLERNPDEPGQEFLVAVAGPAANLLVVIALVAWLRSDGITAEVSKAVLGGPFLERLMHVNLLLFVFNMLPAFPMDGGRALRALLAFRLKYLTATQIAVRLGQAAAIALAVCSLVFHMDLILLFVALFMFFGASDELKQAPIREALKPIRAAVRGIHVRDVMVRQFMTVRPKDTVEDAAKALLDDSLDEVPVVENGRVAGLLAKEILVHLLAEEDGPSRPVGELMRSDIPSLEEGDPLETAFQLVQEMRCPTFPVMHDGVLVGILPLGKLIADSENRLREASSPDVETEDHKS
jgi:Zn-dependent protease/predicted transcriptional regulator